MSDIQNRLLSLDHFEFCFNEEEQTYQFRTNGGYIYSVTFQEFILFDAPVYMFNIDRRVDAIAGTITKGRKQILHGMNTRTSPLLRFRRYIQQLKHKRQHPKTVNYLDIINKDRYDE